MKGVVTYFSREKGFGFIKEARTQFSYFFNHTNMLDLSLVQGDIVTFEEGVNKKGRCAIKVKII